MLCRIVLPERGVGSGRAPPENHAYASEKQSLKGARSRLDRGSRERGDRVERADREQYYAKPFGSGPGGRDKQPDPNSPFAKLAALKQQLEQGSKEPT